MWQTLRSIALAVSACVAGIAVMSSAGCSGAASGVAATANTASKTTAQALKASATVVQTTKYVVNNVPEVVYDLVATILTQNNTSWGSPQQIIVTDTDYVFLFATPASERLRTGVPRMVVIHRDNSTDPTQPF